tara:strand:- start:6693 stop:6869 length:177 start_codon:yes stop_codon:yes gene_type:complete
MNVGSHLSTAHIERIKHLVELGETNAIIARRMGLSPKRIAYYRRKFQSEKAAKTTEKE